MHLLYYFQRQHFENPSSFHSIQLDCEDGISNIFWAQMILWLWIMIILVTWFLWTLHTEQMKIFLSFLQFLGLNHHRHLVVFGAALIHDDSFDSIKWLFKTFIVTMSGKKPKVILTDQDATIIQAIESVLPGISHCVCMWQMYQNALTYLINISKDSDTFFENFRSCIFYHEDEEDFVKAWDAMIEKFRLLVKMDIRGERKMGGSVWEKRIFY